MTIKIKKPEIIQKSIDNEWLHVFLVANPILAIVTKVIIENYGIKRENVLIISLRDTSLEILDYEFLKIQKEKYDRYFEKIFFDSPSGRKIQKHINKSNKEFIIYSGWAFREVNWLLKSNNCKGNIHIEEGQGAYMNYTPFSFDRLSFYEKIRMNWANKVIPTAQIPNLEGTGNCFRDDTKAYIGIDSNSFPLIPNSKRFTLEKIQIVKKYYKSKTSGNRIIGLTCSASRLPKKNDTKRMLQKLINYLPEGSLVKPHPSYTSSKEVFKDFINIFNDLNSKKIELCDASVILEIEMMYEPKIIIGPQSSLSIYTKLLGSKYEYIKLY